MRKYLTNYRNFLEQEIASKKTFKKPELEEVLVKITFFQHERLIHLLVTLFFSLFAIIFLILGMVSLLFLIPFGLFLLFVLCYIIHYYFLEKNTQYLYTLYDTMLERVE